MITDHLGKEYNSKSEMCRNYSISRSTYRNRINAGWSQCDALCTPSKNQDLSGKDFNFLHVISSTNNRTNSGKIIWKCKCRCGEIVFVPSDKIISGATKSCGCIKDDMVHKSMRIPNHGKKNKGVYCKRSTKKYISRIMRNLKSYHLGVFDCEDDAQNMYNIANSFMDIADLELWFLNKNYYFSEFKKICDLYNIKMSKVIDGIFNGFDDKLYLYLNELEKYVKGFSEGYYG